MTWALVHADLAVQGIILVCEVLAMYVIGFCIRARRRGLDDIEEAAKRWRRENGFVNIDAVLMFSLVAFGSIAFSDFIAHAFVDAFLAAYAATFK